MKLKKNHHKSRDSAWFYLQSVTKNQQTWLGNIKIKMVSFDMKL